MASVHHSISRRAPALVAVQARLWCRRVRGFHAASDAVSASWVWNGETRPGASLSAYNTYEVLRYGTDRLDVAAILSCAVTASIPVPAYFSHVPVLPAVYVLR